MKERIFLLILCSFALSVVDALWHHYAVLSLQESIMEYRKDIDAVDQEYKELEQEIAAYKTTSYILGALVPEEFLPCGYSSVVTLS